MKKLPARSGFNSIVCETSHLCQDHLLTYLLT